ncbi:trypsin-like peptidase domain-containing protein [Streptomyces sp. A3M-1-3]|uniref:S1C family serine protease n=1 Tax=Streptomyces sp. A3M-1-3 TaxID=2962044 RepID=UPI0020B757D6|nr:trypsin-like peptidase domain-containing protein [Streptomyces sp. A3M-1-3]MCP3820801.1 trypsin-like peptidase domain-containing protein [Streptomyces sp. A3M-1-3]
MDEGKPTGPKAKWWSRPRTGGNPGEPDPVTEELPPVDDSVPAQTAPRPQPLHAPDPYGTPPYGGPGPWAPAPPVQRPVPTPAQGTPLPPSAFTGNPVPQHPAAQHLAAQHPAQPLPLPQPRAQWGQYDPWGAPLQLSDGGESARPKKARRGGLLAGALLLALVAGGIGGGIGAYVERNGGVTTVELPQAGPESGDRAPDSVAGIAASALPSVVTLHVQGGGSQGTGTGFVLDGRGHILTNNHVVEAASSSGGITVTFSGGETAEAEIVGRDSGYDLAVVKVKGVSGLKPLPLGNSDNVRVGDPVVAIGAPFDLSNTVTSGIISAKERPITAGGEKGDGSDISYVDALQTDAPINPGNSGGPLVDSKARVIGINSAIRAADNGSDLADGQAGSIGLGFAIPINQGKRVAEELISTGKATHPVIGVTLDMQYTGDGARVGAKNNDGKPPVTVGGPGDKAGIEPRDIITKVDGRRVHSGEELIVKIRAHRPGDRLELTVVRDGRERTLGVVLGSADGT